MEHIWDMEVNLFSKTIETHILHLRKKIDCKRAKPLIKTISGRGYKFEWNIKGLNYNIKKLTNLQIFSKNKILKIMENLIKEILTNRTFRNSTSLASFIAATFNVGHPWG